MVPVNEFTFSCIFSWCLLALNLIFMTARITTVAIINITTTTPTAPRMPAMRVVECSIKFVVETVPVLEEEEGEEELLGFSASPVEVVVAITVSS